MSEEEDSEERPQPYLTPGQERLIKAHKEFKDAGAARLAEASQLQSASEWEAYERRKRIYEDEVARQTEYYRLKDENEWEKTAKEREVAEKELATAVAREKAALAMAQAAAEEADRVRGMRRQAEAMAHQKRQLVDQVIHKAVEVAGPPTQYGYDRAAPTVEEDGDAEGPDQCCCC